MKYPMLAAKLYNTPLLLTRQKAEVIEQIFRRREEGAPALLAPSPDASSESDRGLEMAAQGFTRAEGGYYRSADGVALIPVMGTLVQRGDSMDAMSGLTGYNRIASQLQAALEDPRTHAIMLEVDSPGGEANGAFDLASKIRAASKIKPVWASANEMAMSSGYLLASAAERLTVPESGMVGSIGVLMMHIDQSVRDAKSGLTYTPIFAGDHKLDFSSHAPLSDSALATGQDEVNRVYDMLVSAVSVHRNMKAQAVRDTQAAALSPGAALKAGLVDKVQSFDETMHELAAEAQNFRMNGRRTKVAEATPLIPGDTIMEPTTATPAPGVAAAAPAATTAAAPAAAAAPSVDAAATERARISGILAHAEAKGRTKLAEHLAFKTTSSIEDAASILATAPKEAAADTTNRFAAAMDAAGNPKVGADAAGTGDAPPPKYATAAEVYAFRQECVQKARSGVRA